MNMFGNIYSVVRLLMNFIVSRKCHNETKIFCIGFNKTGTTSVKKVFEGFNYRVGSQRMAEELSGAYHNGRWDLIIKYCESACAFQDIPFSWPNTYRHLYDEYPNAKFILTVRDDELQWYQSLKKFHTKRFGRLPTREDLEASGYVSKGWEWDNYVNRFGENQTDLWNEEMRTNDYVKHNRDVVEFFRDKPGQLLVLNVKEESAYRKLANFLGQSVPLDAQFPWENKT